MGRRSDSGKQVSRRGIVWSEPPVLGSASASKQVPAIDTGSSPRIHMSPCSAARATARRSHWMTQPAHSHSPRKTSRTDAARGERQEMSGERQPSTWLSVGGRFSLLCQHSLAMSGGRQQRRGAGAYRAVLSEPAAVLLAAVAAGTVPRRAGRRETLCRRMPRRRG